MRIAVSSNDHRTVTGHAGRARKWLVYDIGEGGAVAPPQALEIPADMIFHVFADDRPHPLDGITALITISAGEGFLKHMEKRGVDAVQTAEKDPTKAVADYLAEKLAPPKARPIGELLCKTIDLFSKHK